MKKTLVVTTVIFTMVFGLVETANANITWSWSFASEAGQFVTDGDIAAAGTYTMVDFLVTSSATGGAIGSLSEGDYATDAFVTYQPFSFDWDGSQVTKWDSAGYNTFDWWAFRDVAVPNQYYFFGWDYGNVNNVDSAAHYDEGLGIYNPISVGDVSVLPSTITVVPAPAGILLAGIGSLLVGLLRKKKVL